MPGKTSKKKISTTGTKNKTTTAGVERKVSAGEKRKVSATGDKPILSQGTNLIPIFIMGKRYEVPETVTIQKAMEYAGYQYIRGCGCRGGICGACATIFRTEGDYKLKTGLACQTVIESGMHLVQIPFVPVNRAQYHIEDLEPTVFQLEKLYPESFRCVSCNTCTKACPMDIQVMDYMSAVMRGDIAEVARLSRSCIMCGLCAARCPAETQQFNVAILCRRLYGKYMQHRAEHLKKRVEEIEKGKYEPMLDELKTLSRRELEKRYEEREWEPEPYEVLNWKPKDTTYL